MGRWMRGWYGLSLLGAIVTGVHAEDGRGPQVAQQVVHLSAQAAQEVPQDWLQLTLSTTREGTDAAGVQAQLKEALDVALLQARRAAQPGSVLVRTGRFSLTPRRVRDNRSLTWQGSVELLLEGRDFATLSKLAGGLQTLVVSQSQFSLSREALTALETQVQAQAIERFKARASETAKAFGFSGYVLREVTLSSADAQGPSPRLMARVAMTEAEAPLPLEAGMSTVRVTVSGSVQMK